MKKLVLTIVAAFAMPFGPETFAQDPTLGVRDPADMFSEDARKQATEKLQAIHQATGWPILIETIETLDGRPVDELALERARALQIRGMYVLLADKERRISTQAHKSVAGVLNTKTRAQFKEKVTDRFKQDKFDQGLLEGVDYLASIIAARESPAPARAPAAVDAGRGSFFRTALIVGGLVLVGMFVIRLIAGLSRAGAGGMGAPGGGFLSGLFGAMGGVFLGHWLYNTFSGGQAHASEPDRSTDHDAGDYESTSGGWDAGDNGGFDGGDFGGDSGGGGDW